MRKVNLAEKLALFNDLWKPRIVGEVNGLQVKLVKIKGEFVWHLHEHEDEMFLVLAGRLTLEFRDRELELEPGEICIVPRRIEHRTSAAVETHLLLVEPPSTINTGNIREDRTQQDLERL